jgi:hypothetical protein
MRRSLSPNIPWWTLALLVLVTTLRGFCLMEPATLLAQSGPPVNATTFHYDRQRTGWNSNETVLTQVVSGHPEPG